LRLAFGFEGLSMSCVHRGSAVIVVDGLIDFLIVEKTSRLKLLMLFPKIFSGKHLNSPYLRYVQTNYIKIETQKPERVNIDGEMKGNTTLEIIVHKHKLKVII
jgi:diacylglycerol kinase family enzyme